LQRKFDVELSAKGGLFSRSSCGLEACLPRLQAMGLRFKLGWLAICSLIALSGTCHAQNSANISSAVVKVDSLAVYPDMNTSGRIVQSLKKGEEVVIDFEMERIESHSDSATHAGGAPVSADISKQRATDHPLGCRVRR